MKDIQSDRLTTIEVESGEVYAVRCETARSVDIFNGSSGDILIAESNEFTSKDGKGAYIRLPPRSGFNGLRTKVLMETVIFIKALGEGTVSLASP